MARPTPRSAARRRSRPLEILTLSRSRREALRTNLWVVPTVMVAIVVACFALTSGVDRDAASGRLSLPPWVSSGSADATRQILIAIAATVITVAGVLFSITILVLQLASQQFGPRVLRNFIRDWGTQISLGAYVGTFVYSVLALASVADPPQLLVPHVSATVAIVLTLVDLGVLIYYIDHVATSIQLTTVVSGIAGDFRSTLENVQVDARRLQEVAGGGNVATSPALPDFTGRIASDASGFLQAIGHGRLVEIATSSEAIIRLLHRPGHFVVEGQLLAVVAPASAASVVTTALTESHIVGPNRTLTQDPGFAIDQLVEVAIRALSPAVNDTFTALNCIDWLGDCLCRACAEPLPSGLYYDTLGQVRLIEPALTVERLIKGACDKIRQAGRGMPAVFIRQLENLQKVSYAARTRSQRDMILHHAEMILRASDESVLEGADRRDVRAAYDSLISISHDLWQG
jgi:uncharacterized membrane protein